jgi:methanogenic corrinoid protein MtbC1
MMSRHEMIISAAETKDASGFDAIYAERCEVLVRYLLEGNYPAGVKMMRDFCRDATSLAGFYEDVLQPSLYEVGRMWETGKINAADEHLATAVAERMIATAYVTMSGRSAGGNARGSTVIATTPDEPHGVGVRMVADLLELKGWDVHFLGVNVPISDIVDLVRRVEPTFVGLSLVMPYNLRNMEQIITQLRSDAKNRSMRIMVGSPVLIWDKDVWRRLGADAFAPNLRSALEIAEGWRKLI